MMFPELSASSYKYTSDFYVSEFETILSKIIICYRIMVDRGVLIVSDENKIRDVILKDYLRDNSIREKLELKDFLFDREVPEDNDLGRTDIKIQTPDTFKDTAAYYIIECKRLDTNNQNGTSGLNGKYISNGICRFISQKYSTYNNTNGMLGFVVEPMDIHSNVGYMNALLKNPIIQANTQQCMQQRKIVDGFDYSYFSTHSVGKDKIIIYHLMLDFSNNIQ